MAFSLTWLPEVLRAAGLKVAEVDGWANRGRAEMGKIRGVICHHTGTSAVGNMPTLRTLVNGRGGSNPLPGPLCQLGLGVDGTYYVVAAGRANHAGAGLWKGLRTGNSNFIGIEAENAGTKGANWPDWQMDAYRRGVAAILRHVGEGAEMCCAHREYALPKGRKVDPFFDMDDFRAGVRDILLGVASVRSSVAAVDEGSGKPTLQRGSRGPDVEIVQRVVGVGDDGKFGPTTEVAVRRFQQLAALRPDGIVGPLTWGEIFDALAETTTGPAGRSIARTDEPDVATANGVPATANKLLDLIGKIEAPQGYGTLFGNNQNKLATPLQSMTVDQIIQVGPSWSKRFRSSACGRYQFMNATLIMLRKSEGLKGSELFGPLLQDQLAYALLKRRGYTKFVTGKITRVAFGLGLAQEWASFPVLTDCKGSHRKVRRGETFYAGDKLNKALIRPEAVEEALGSIV
ncbi:N-acetylmuramoyl-L-alanine amidase [Methylopila sp. M107]|uniref:N-acetylmuramoyl-L-alanine amidase n=1 Tax=Methylopila sp. M107 TaxID=1101190 RepID=UPI00037B52DB|nr:N-acetylmuramoyl-L-alanine amidase [Methylopila sp. M107]